jgi:type IV fimbrial biogenesis protein FimT
VLRPAFRVRGFSLIELMVVVALIGILMALGVPAIGSWMADARLRATAESLTNQLRLAQSAAVTRNRVSMLVLTNATTPAYNATPVANGTSWMVLVDPLGSEAWAAASSTDAGSMISSSSEARQHGVTVSGPSVVCFNSLGQQTTNLTTALPTAGTVCATPGTDDTAAASSVQSASKITSYELTRTGAKRTFRVLVYAGGRVRMCDALKTLSTTNPDGCP